MLYGDAAAEYAKVYEYGFAILKYNPGSSAIVWVENVETPPPHFQRMYVCLDACKQGYRRCCRPIIGVDGCHLKGAYPGMILAAVSKDGNNNIYPIAWAVVEVENQSSCTWFLEQLLKDVGHMDGQGLTLMSNRQKGLVDAIAAVAPKAEVRFCCRHIWANFKLKFNGSIFKQYFWRAAKATTKFSFDAEMAAIQFLSQEAFDWLNKIPASCWSRHAFSTQSKSNMLLNNICESFNAPIRQARSQPIITCLEWIRRYVMKRHSEKWEGVQKYEGRLMPYVGKVLGWISKSASECIPCHSRLDEWEVDTTCARFVVNLREHTCTCNHWMLTGIPCPHAYACVIAKRGRPEDYVIDYYTKTTYIDAYSIHIKPMPGKEHWEASSLPPPLPPIIRKMPGRPSQKRRKKEAGEEEQGNTVKRGGKPNMCSNCGVFGHKKNKCQNQTAPPAPKKKGGRPPSNDAWVVAQRKKREERAATMTYVPPSMTEASSSQAQPEQSS